VTADRLILGRIAVVAEATAQQDGTREQRERRERGGAQGHVARF